MPPLSADPSRTQAGGVSACQAKRFQAARLSASIARSATPSYLGSSRTNNPLGSNFSGVSPSPTRPSSLNAPILGPLGGLPSRPSASASPSNPPLRSATQSE